MFPKAPCLRLGILFLTVSCNVMACIHVPLKYLETDAGYSYQNHGETVTLDGIEKFYCPYSHEITEYKWIIPSQAYCIEGQGTSQLKCKFLPGNCVVELQVKCSGGIWNTAHPEYPTKNKYVFYISTSSVSGLWHITPQGNDYNDGRTWESAFKTFDVAIKTALAGHTIKVAPGDYDQTLDFGGKNVVVTSEDPNGVLTGWDITNCTVITPVSGPGVVFKGTESTACQLKGFTVNCNHQRGTISEYDLTDSLEVHLKLDETSGQTVSDCSGNGRNGTVDFTTTSSNWVDGIIDGSFKGNDGFDVAITLDDYKGVLGSQSRTVTAWVKHRPTNTGYISAGVTQWGDSSNHGWNFCINTQGVLSVNGFGGGAEGSTYLNAQQWYHVAAVFRNDGVPQVEDVELYVNGKPEIINYWPVNEPDAPFEETLSGINVKVGDASGNPMDVIDDFRVYSRALDEAEIRLTASQGGIRGNGTLASISMCVIENNYSAGYGGGISEVNGEISTCYVLNNTALLGGGGLTGCGGIIRNCVIAGNQSECGAAIHDSTADIINCTIVDNIADAGAAAIQNCTGVSKNCVLWGNTPNQYANSTVPAYSCVQGWTSNPESPFNFSDDPLFIDANKGNYHISLSPPSPCIDGGDPSCQDCGKLDIDGGARRTFSGVDVGADEIDGVYLSDKGLCRTIQEAIDRSFSGDVVIVAPGLYYENIDFKGKAITVQSWQPTDPEYIESTIIRGGPDDHIVSFRNAEYGNTKLSGITIQDDGIQGNRAAIYCNGASPKITYCNIDNIVCSYYGAVQIGSYSMPIFRFCTITGCNKDGIYANNWAGCEAYRCTISNNDQYGINMGETYGSTVRFKNCLIADNGYKGIYGECGYLALENCTIVNNKGGVYGYYGTSQKEIINCVMWGNDTQYGDVDLYIPASYSSWSINYSCTGNDISAYDLGFGNITANPSFQNVSESNYHLTSNSPCIDAGSPAYPYMLEPSPNGSRVNMGAYGNTDEAESTTTDVDSDSDGLRDSWELDSIGSLAQDADDDEEDGGNGDGFTNRVEYVFGYNPTAITTQPLTLQKCVTQQYMEPRGEQQTIAFTYMFNKDANIRIRFYKTNTTSTSYSRQMPATGTVAVTAGAVNTCVWDGTNESGVLVEPYFYHIEIYAESGGETLTWRSSETDYGTTFYNTSQGAYDYVVGTEEFNPFQSIPVTAACSYNDWIVRDIIVKYDNDWSLDNPYAILADEAFLRPGINKYEWYGRKTATNPNEIATGQYRVYYESASGVTKGPVLLYYPPLLTDLRIHPYRVVPTQHEIATVSYNLGFTANVSVTIYDPDGSLFAVLVNNQVQSAGKQEVIWYGKDHLPNDPDAGDLNEGVVWYGGDANPNTYDSRYSLKEGVYRVEVKLEDYDNEELQGSITVHR